MVETKPTLSKQNKTILFLMALIFAIFFIANPLNIIVKAESNRITSVIEDLQTDPNFSVENYPSITPTKPDDYNLQVIQIAESTAKELFIYVYQPTAVTKELKATSINISTSIGDNFAPKNYDLTFLNSRGVFQKYVVENFYVKNDALRYYDITSIFRAFDKEIDTEASGGNTISERSYEVGQLWTACTVNGEVSYNYTEEEIIKIPEKYVGFIRYPANKPTWYYQKFTNACDSHFVAFSTDKPVEKLMEVDVKFTTQYCHFETGNFQGTIYETPNEENYRTIKADNKVTYEGEGNGIIPSSKYEWNRIQTVDDFIAKNEDFSIVYEHGVVNTTTHLNLKNSTKEELKNKQWVLCFTETDYSHTSSNLSHGGTVHRYKYTLVSDVTILRLKFETDGKVYNLGVVDNKQTGSGIQDNEINIENKVLWDRLLIILLIIIAIICLPFIIMNLPAIFHFIFWVISLPFKLIKNIFNLFKRRK